MARTFVTASTQYFEISSCLVSVNGAYSMACWFNRAATSNNAMISFGDSTGGVNDRITLFCGAPAAYNLVFQVFSSGASDNATTSTGHTEGAWYHAAAVQTSSSSRAVFLNGGGKGTSSTSKTVGTLNRTNLGIRWSGGTRGSAYGGQLAEVGIWNTNLTDSEVAVLAAGYCPLFVRPSNLLGYWPLFARATNEEQWVGADAFVPGNSPTASNHPSRIIYPSRRRRIYIPAAATAPLRFNSSLNGLGGSGPFFHDRLAAGACK